MVHRWLIGSTWRAVSGTERLFVHMQACTCSLIRSRPTVDDCTEYRRLTCNVQRTRSVSPDWINPARDEIDLRRCIRTTQSQNVGSRTVKARMTPAYWRICIPSSPLNLLPVSCHLARNMLNPFQLTVPKIATATLIRGFDSRLANRPFLVLTFRHWRSTLSARGLSARVPESQN